MSFHEFAEREIRFRMLERLDPMRARELFIAADEAARRRYRLYQELAKLDFGGPPEPEPSRRALGLEGSHIPAGVFTTAPEEVGG